MYRCFSLLIGILFCVATSFSQCKLDKHVVQKQLKDFAIFKEAILTNAAGLYYYQNEIQFKARLDTLEQQLKSESTELEIYKAYAHCIASIQCGHTVIIVKKIYNQYLKSKSSLPFPVYYINGKLFVKEAYQKNKLVLPKYTEITAINDESISNLANYTSRFISSDGSNQTHKNERMKYKFMFYYYCFNTPHDSLKITYIRSQKDTLSQYIDLSTPPKEKRMKESDFNKQLERHIDTLQNRALLTLPNPLPRNNTYKMQLDTFFVFLHQHKIENLIIDLRGNTGGLSQYYLTGFFCDSSYMYESRTLQSKKKPNFHYQKPFDSQRISIFYSRIATRNGKTSTIKASKPHGERFKGNVYILTDGWTFSAAANLTSILKEHSNAITIGEETGGSYRRCSSGNLLLKLPYSKLMIKINPMMYVNHVKTVDHQGGVLPDFEVKPSNKWDDSEDVQLQFVYQLIAD